MMTVGKMIIFARPYARAAFEYALAKNQLLLWETMLTHAARVVEDQRVAQIIHRSRVASSQVAELINSILQSTLTTEQRNFIHLLAENKRLLALPDIAELFKTYRAQHEQQLTVEVNSAIELSKEYQDKLKKALTHRLKRQVTLQCTVDSNLLGGAIIRAGDNVIDGSIRGKLKRLLEFI